MTTPDFPADTPPERIAVLTIAASCPKDAHPHPRELRLARELGYTRHVLRRLMPNAEYMEWVVLMRLEDEAHKKAAEDAKRRRR